MYTKIPLPALAFIWLVIEYKKTDNQPLEVYYLKYSLKLNLTAAFALVFVSILMIVLGGFNSAWTWVYVITYFTFVHTVFILIAVWAMTRAWSGKKLKSETLTKELL